jgi:hypothetical protein
MNPTSVKHLLNEHAACPHCGNDSSETLEILDDQPEPNRTHVVCHKCDNLYKMNDDMIFSRCHTWQFIQRTGKLTFFIAVFVGSVVGNCVGCFIYHLVNG